MVTVPIDLARKGQTELFNCDGDIDGFGIIAFVQAVAGVRVGS